MRSRGILIIAAMAASALALWSVGRAFAQGRGSEDAPIEMDAFRIEGRVAEPPATVIGGHTMESWSEAEWNEFFTSRVRDPVRDDLLALQESLSSDISAIGGPSAQVLRHMAADSLLGGEMDLVPVDIVTEINQASLCCTLSGPLSLSAEERSSHASISAREQNYCGSRAGDYSAGRSLAAAMDRVRAMESSLRVDASVCSSSNLARAYSTASSDEAGGVCSSASPSDAESWVASRAAQFLPPFNEAECRANPVGYMREAMQSATASLRIAERIYEMNDVPIRERVMLWRRTFGPIDSATAAARRLRGPERTPEQARLAALEDARMLRRRRFICPEAMMAATDAEVESSGCGRLPTMATVYEARSAMITSSASLEEFHGYMQNVIGARRCTNQFYYQLFRTGLASAVAADPEADDRYDVAVGSVREQIASCVRSRLSPAATRYLSDRETARATERLISSIDHPADMVLTGDGVPASETVPGTRVREEYPGEGLRRGPPEDIAEIADGPLVDADSAGE